MCAYALNASRTEEDQQVPGDVDDQIQDEEEAGHADEELRADGGSKTRRSRDDIDRSSLLLRRR